MLYGQLSLLVYCLFTVYTGLLSNNFYTAQCKKHPKAILTVDAAGSIVKRELSQDSPVFLYQCILISKNGKISIYQMISADHMALIIYFLFHNISARNVPVPCIVVTDFS